MNQTILPDETSSSLVSTIKCGIQERIFFLKERFNEDVLTIVKELGGSSLVFDEDRFYVAKKFLFLSYLVGELNIIIATVWRYQDESDSSLLSPYVDEVLNELDDLRKNMDAFVQAGVELTSYEVKSRLKKFYEFLMKFDVDLERKLSEVSGLVPYETRLMDILSCSPTADFKLSVISPHRQCKYCNVIASYNLRNLKCLYEALRETGAEPPDSSDQSKVVTYVRDCVRCDNVVYLQNIVNDLAALECEYRSLPGDDRRGKYRKLKVLASRYDSVMTDLFRQPVYTPCVTELENQIFVQDIYSRDVVSSEPPVLRLSMHVACLHYEYLPLMVLSHRIHSGEIISSKRCDAIVKGLLTEYHRAFRLPAKPEVELTVNFGGGSGDPTVITMKTSYDKKKRFFIDRVDFTE